MRSRSLFHAQSSLKLASLVGAASLVAVFAACAEAPVDEDPGGATSQVNKAEPEHESQTLPPSNPPAQKQEVKEDAGSTSSSGGSSSGGSSSGGSSSGGSSSGGSSSGGSSSGGSSSGGASASCDANDPINLFLALDEVSKTSPRYCGSMGGSCAAAECCFDVYGVCIDQ